MGARSLALAGSLAIVCLTLAAATRAASSAPERVTVFGDSVATAMEYDPVARKMLARGVDLELETAPCRRVGDTSCPYKGVTPPNVIDRATELGSQLGPVVVVAVGYNDYEANYAKNIDDAMAVFRKAGVQHVLWLTLLESRSSWANMNDMLTAAARRYPEITVLDWNAAAKPHSDWFQPGASPHLTASGAQGMAALIEDALVQLDVVQKVTTPPKRKLLAITSRALPAGHVGRRYAATLKASGGKAPYRWARTRGVLPRGLHLLANGRVRGVPRRAGSFSLRVRVVDGTGTARARVFSLRIA